MNVCYLDKDQNKCAKYHNDKHCVKMILEYAQLMCTAHRIVDDNQTAFLYKAAHKNHPSTIWTRISKSNYEWLYKLFVELSEEYTYRYDRVHKSYLNLKEILSNPPSKIPDKGFTEPPPAMPEYCKIIGDSVSSYRNYYRQEKKHIAKWTKRPVPNWY